MNLALFDFDGTITDRELFADFVRMAVTPRQRVIGQIVLAPVHVGYKLGLVSGSTIRSRVADFAFRDLLALAHRRWYRGREIG